MRKRISRAIVVVAASFVLLIGAAGAADAYVLSGRYIGSNVWYNTTNQFTTETRNQARQAMIEWNTYLPEGQRVCYDSTVATEGYYPRRNNVNVISKFFTTDGYYAQNSLWVSSSTRAIVESDINLNPSMSWHNSPPVDTTTIIRPQYVLLHELGHTVGLNDTYDPNVLAIMYYATQPFYNYLSLQSDDIAGVRSIY